MGPKKDAIRHCAKQDTAAAVRAYVDDLVEQERNHAGDVVEVGDVARLHLLQCVRIMIDFLAARRNLRTDDMTTCR